MNWLVAGALVPSLLVSWLAGFAVRRWAPHLGLVDKPGGHKAHAQPTPLGGGLAIALGIALPLALGSLWVWRWATNSGSSLVPGVFNQFGEGLISSAVMNFEPHLPGVYSRLPDLWWLLAAGGVLMLLGLWDDARGLDWRLRLGVQFLVVASLVYRRGWQLTLFWDLPVVTGALTVLWIAGLVNSFNMLDNMDGLSAGVAAIAATSVAVLLLIAPQGSGQPQLFVAGLLFTLVGALLGFLWHNRPPARLFMGDAGSYLVGFLLGVSTVLATFAGSGRPWHAILAPLCVLAVPLYDTLSVVLIRLHAGRSPFAADRNHISHRLVALGLSPTQAVLVIYGATALCGVAAVVLYHVELPGAVAILLGVAGMLGVVAMLEIRLEA